MAEMVAVLSSMIDEIGYDQDTSSLHVNFGKGAYVYENVPWEVYNDLVTAPSAGGYFISNIRGKYNFRKAS